MASRRTAILTFMIGGPLIWLPVFFAWAKIRGYDFHDSSASSLLLTPAIGGFLWCFAAISPRGWLYTWIPTLSTSLLYAALFPRLPLARISWLRARIPSIALHCTLTAAVSALIFSACITVGTLLGLQTPLLSTAHSLPDSFVIPNVSLTRETLVGMTAVIGGLLGALLGALSPSSDVPGVDTLRSRAPCALPPSPSPRRIIGTFFVVGPLLYLPVMSILSQFQIGGPTFHGRQVVGVMILPLLAPMGAIGWYGACFFPSAWLLTWIPTLGTAVLFWAVLARSPIRRWASSVGALWMVLAYATTCGALSVSVFALCQLLGAPLAHRAAGGPDDNKFESLIQSAAGHTILTAVAILGVLIGTAICFFEMRKRRSGNLPAL